MSDTKFKGKLFRLESQLNVPHTSPWFKKLFDKAMNSKDSYTFKMLVEDTKNEQLRLNFKEE